MCIEIRQSSVETDTDLSVFFRNVGYFLRKSPSQDSFDQREILKLPAMSNQQITSTKYVIYKEIK